MALRSEAIVRRGIGWASAILAVAVAGFAPGPRIEGLKDPPEGLTVVDGLIRVPRGAWLQLGSGRSLAITLEPAGASFDLVIGPPDQPLYSAGLTADRLGLYDAEGLMIGRGGGLSPNPGQVIRFELDCQPPLQLRMDQNVTDIADASQGCPAGPLSLHAATPLHIRAIELDDRLLVVNLKRLHPEPALAAAAAALTLGVVLGASCLIPLLLSPLALLLPKLGLPALAGLALLGGACGVSGAMEHSGVRRGFGALAAVFGFIGAGVAVLAATGPTGLEAGQSEQVARALARRVNIDSFRYKVDTAVASIGPNLAKRAPDKPLLLALGSSSTGGSGSGRFWPQVVQEQLPGLHVESLAVGGATTWHIKNLLDGLGVRADICVLYAGHNDTLATLPGLSLAALERGEAPTIDKFVPPVPLSDARENIVAMQRWCGQTLVMQELSIGREAAMDEYAAMLRTVPGAVWADGAGRLAQAPRNVAMLDQVHPTARGHEILGAFVVEQVRAWTE